MKTSQSLIVTQISLVLSLCSMLLSGPRVHADTPVSVDSTPVGTIDGFDLYGHGIYWWTSGYIGDEVIRAQDGILAWRSAIPGVSLIQRGSRTIYAAQTKTIVAPTEGSVRTDSDIYFYANQLGMRIFRRSLFGTAPADLGNDFSGVSYDQVGAMIQYGGSLIWSVVQGGQSQIRMKALNGGPGGGDEILFTGTGLAKKMALATVTVDENAPDFTYLIVLGFDGSIYTYVLDPSIQRPGPFLLATNVSDMAVRPETHRAFNGGILGITLRHTTILYAATGVNLSANRLSGRLVAFDLREGTNATDYDSGSPDEQFTGVGVDNGHLFLTQTHVIPGSGLFGPRLDLPNSQILRKDSPADNTLILIPIGNFETIARVQEGRNLRSDGRWLYWANGNEIRKIGTDAPAIELDFRAIGLEAVQTVQDYNNSIPLVQFKGTIVRGYAQVVKNNGTGLSRFNLSAQLRGFLDGTELPDSPVYPYGFGLVDNAGDLPTLRSSLSRSFNFQLPDSWLARAGSLRMEFFLDPQGNSLETGNTALDNNKATVTLNIVAGRRPCVVFKTMSATTPNYDMFAPNSGFGDIVDRANSMLPLDHLKTFFSPGSVTRPVLTLLGIKGRSFAIPDQQNQALAELKEAEEDSDDPPGCTDVHWAGMFPPDVQNFNGLGQMPGNCLILRMDSIGSRGGIWGSIVGGHSLAHELSHNYGRKHIDQTLSGTGCGASQPGGPWDVEPAGQDPCTLGVTDLTQASAPIGYDWLTDTLVLPNASADMMTYGSPRWASPFTWNALVSAIPVTPLNYVEENPSNGRMAPASRVVPAGNPPQPHGPIFRVTGTIEPALNQASLLPAWQFPAGTLDPVKVQRSLDAAAALPVDAPYRLRLIGDPQAAPLLEQPVAVETTADGDAGTLHFVQAVPFVAGVTKIQLIGNGTVLAEIQASAHSPTLQLQAPVFDAATHSLKLAWTAADADGDSLYFTTQLSHDNGSTWHTLQVHDPALGLAINTTALPGGDQCRLRVLATDGLNTAIAMTDPFALPKQAPIINIGGIHDQQQFPQAGAVFGQIIAYDPEDGSLDPSAIHWTLSGLESRSGTGTGVSLRGLAPGAYELNATAADADGNSGSATTHFQVQPIVISDGPAPVLDGLPADAAYDGGALVQMRVNQGSRTPTNVRFIHSGGYLYVSFSDLDYSTTANLPATAGIYFDLNASRDATSQATDVGFGVNEDGVLNQYAGNGTSMVLQPVSSGFTAEIALGNTTWSAELRISDALLGGWNHVAGLMLAHYFPNLFGQIKLFPQSGNFNNPNTWTSASLGPLPPATNNPPVAVASGPALVSFTESQLVTLNGSGSYDLDGDPITYSWMQISGPPVSLTDTNSAAPSFTTDNITTEADVVFQLVVRDSQVESPPATVNVHLVPVTAQTASLQPPAGSGPRLTLTVNTSSTSSSGLNIVSGPEVFDRQNIATDTTQNDYGWIGAGANAVTYSLTIASFPTPAFSGFQAHIFLVPNSTGLVAPDYDEPSMAMLDIRANSDGTASAWFRYKINAPMSNDFVYGDGTLGQVDCATGALGTWSVSFLNDSSITLTAPNGSLKNLAFPDAAAARSAFGGKVAAYFGNQANDTSQVGQATTFSRISIQGTPRAPAVDETFPGPDLNQHPQTVSWSWQKLAASPSGISIPTTATDGLAVSWTLPDDGFVLQFSPTLSPPAWTSSGLQNVVAQAGSKTAFVPRSALPNFYGGYFRMIKNQ